MFTKNRGYAILRQKDLIEGIWMETYTNNNKKPEITVIIPSYNVEEYIGECLESLKKQTFTDFEVLCVDDGSDDRTVDIIKEYAVSDPRFQYVGMDHCGKAGLMRNEGIKRAKGEYLLFLDSDDFFESELMEHSLNKIKEDQADVCMYDARLYFGDTGKYRKSNVIQKKEYIPQTMPVEGKSFPYVFNIGTGCPWTSLFKKSLIDENKLEFMALSRSNDIYFVNMALVLAKRITMIQEVLVNYRQRSTSLQANNTKTPWDWYEALKAIRDKLKELDLYDTVETSFKNLAFGVSIYNMCSLKAGEAFCQIYERLNNEIFAEFDLDDFTEEECYSYNAAKYQIYMQMKECSAVEYLFRQAQEMKEWQSRAKKAEKELKKLKSSTTLKVGKALLYIPKKLKHMTGKK